MRRTSSRDKTRAPAKRNAGSITTATKDGGREQPGKNPAPPPEAGAFAEADPRQRDPNLLQVPMTADEYFPDALARAALRPNVLAAGLIRNFTRGSVPETLDTTSVITELSNQAKAVVAGDMTRVEGMLITQAHVLNAIFTEMARRAALNMNEYLGPAETYMRLALKAQTQCRTTLEALAEIKNPKAVAFVRQANIATAGGQQQVNNGVSASRTENSSNELLGAGKDETPAIGMDAGAASPPIGVGAQLAAVGALDRTANGRG